MAKVKSQKVKAECLVELDAFLEVKDIKNGDILYECDIFLGENHEFKAITDAQFLNGGWSCLIQDKSGNKHELYVSGSTKSVYLPNLYKFPIF